MSDKEKINTKKSGLSVYKTVLLYIIVPVVFSAVLLIALIPAFIKADKLAESYIATAREKISNSGSIIVFNDEAYISSDITDGEVKLDKRLAKGDKIGSLVCENAGVNTDIYYGIGVQILGRGAGLNPDYGLFGEDKVVYLEGLQAEALKNFDSISEGDIIEIKTFYGTFGYRVSAESFENSKADLVICSVYSAEPFGKSEKQYICAYKISGPVLQHGEVQ